MVHSPSNLHEQGLTLLFGPQDPDINEAYTKKLRSTLLETPSLEWILEATMGLIQHWQSISQTLPELLASPGQKHLEALNEWLRRGKFPQELFPLPNIIVTPLVVITHLVQYLGFLKEVHPELAASDSLQAALKLPTETVGLCTGMLSSAAVASSENLAQLEKHGAVAIRMAMAIGASVDAADVDTDLKGKWQSVAVGWKSVDARKELAKILKGFPEAYLSVISEEKLATVTTPKNVAAPLLKQLRDAGLIFVETALRGAFHCGSRSQEATSLIKLFDSDPSFQFPDFSLLAFSTRSASGAEYFAGDKLHHTAVQAMLTDQADWHQVFTSLQSSNSRSLVVVFGRERCVPQWVVRKLGPRLMQGANVDLNSCRLPPQFDRVLRPSEDDAVAIVGLACHLPGGDDLDGFWDTLCAGKSQHVKVPTERLDFQTTAWREYDSERKWYGNFVRDHDAFDHRFFKKSGREMASTDPQQRLMLQVAYQAVEQSGYFTMPTTPDAHIGCYVGIGVADYENNVAGHPANAYTATGNLKSFAAGKISHYFGWSGPGITIDTACSSSAVAVHHACQAILSGECSAALAGGTSIMSSPEWYQNLDGASFLSPTGQCKPFDVDADGYCRGEGAGAVFLKKLSAAIEDGNQIFGVINASSVNQNENCSAITAPSVLSLSNVFSNVIHKAGLDPKQISVVEAHGTGTQVGDRAEYDSIRKVFGGPGRTESLSLGSVKGLVGHLECASGIAALIKTLLMLYNGAIPPQPSFNAISPKLNAMPSDNIEITKKFKNWDTDFRVALINNYGASGSNASLIVTQAPSSRSTDLDCVISEAQTISKSPFWLCGLDAQSLRSYSTKLVQLLRSSKKTDHRFTIANLSFQLFRQSNRSLSQGLIFSCSSVDELTEKLASFANGQGELSSVSRHVPPRPVILCFGGQASKFVGLDREIYDQVKLLRTHLDLCNEMCLSLGLDSIYPAIFQRTPIEDIVSLQTMLFAIQYSCAKSWIESGVQVAAVIGHSFGELTAYCVSGTLSVKDTLKMVADRARIIQQKWGPEKGCMIAVDGNLTDVERLLHETNNTNPDETATIACFNGPRSFTLAGTSKAIELLRETITTNQGFSSIKTKQLDVTNAFHSSLVDSLMADLATVGDELIFREPTIPLERASKDVASALPMPGFVGSHMRYPVYFNHAVQRLAQKYPSGIWLEAGSNSGITTMASRALGSPKSSHFQPVNITGPEALKHLTDATTNLWKEGLNTTFWTHHIEQTSDYSPLLLPPYQFEKSKHWLARTKRQVRNDSPAPQIQQAPVGLWNFMGYQDSAKTHARFQVNTVSEEYRTYVSAHVIAQTAPICPSTFQHVIAVHALESLAPVSNDPSLLPELQGMESSAPLCLDASRLVWLDAKRTGANDNTWDWSITSTSIGGNTSDANLHVSGRIVFRHTKDAAYDFAKYERLVDRERSLALLDGPEADQVIQGSRNIYKAFASIVQYNHDEYRGLQKIAAKGNESAGRIKKQDGKGTALSVGLADTFCQVAGIFLNCMTDCEDGDMFLSNRVDQWIRSPTVSRDSRPELWEVYARHHSPSDKEYVSDMFVFDSVSGELVWVVLGLHFVKVSINGMARLLTRLSSATKTTRGALTPPSTPPEMANTEDSHPAFSSKPAESMPLPKLVRQKRVKKNTTPRRDISSDARGLLCNLLGLDAEEVKPKSDLVELGIDSLLAMEVAREVENEFKTKLELEELMEMTDFQSLQLTDHFIEENNFSGYMNQVLPKQNELVLIHIVDAFEQIGCPLRTAEAGQVLDRISYLHKHEQVISVFYGLLEKARLVDLDGSRITRTAIPVPSKSAATLLQELLSESPEHSYDHKLTSLTGSRLADCLTGKTDGIQLIFGTPEGRELVAGTYALSPMNVAWIASWNTFGSNSYSACPGSVSRSPYWSWVLGPVERQHD
ncbi:Citrinin polyketide synthase [Lachnellula occidentalis]|uniref:Citrinin polyketide synthase n=1 Tax=Lachnellula occidentalis TaxID=215460 RepID=A0A8H8UKB4_9HELO|nr:Citrinin polyketide synthase [Lachnellula occidentalis]